jgi:hypothetical protein
MSRPELDHHTVRIIQSGHREVGWPIEVENDSCGARHSFGDPNPVDERPAYIARRETMGVDQGPRVKDIEEQAVGVDSMVGAVFKRARRLDDDSDGIRMGPGSDACNLN